MREENPNDTYEVGLMAETVAAWFYRLKGFRILARRYKTPVGEVDLIARRGKTIVFVEVKARRTLDAALESLTPAMRGRIERAAALFVARHQHHADGDIRFDLFAFKPPFSWRHLDNAWRPYA